MVDGLTVGSREGTLEGVVVVGCGREGEVEGLNVGALVVGLLTVGFAVFCSLVGLCDEVTGALVGEEEIEGEEDGDVHHVSFSFGGGIDDCNEGDIVLSSVIGVAVEGRFVG